jgi:hypothetical protein
MISLHAQGTFDTNSGIFDTIWARIEAGIHGGDSNASEGLSPGKRILFTTLIHMGIVEYSESGNFFPRLVESTTIQPLLDAAKRAT